MSGKLETQMSGWDNESFTNPFLSQLHFVGLQVGKLDGAENHVFQCTHFCMVFFFSSLEMQMVPWWTVDLLHWLWHSMLFNALSAALPAVPNVTDNGTTSEHPLSPRRSSEQDSPCSQGWRSPLEVVWGGTECVCAEKSRGILVTFWNGENCLIFQPLARDPTLP